jgi:hypothetical protein
MAQSQFERFYDSSQDLRNESQFKLYPDFSANASPHIKSRQIDVLLQYREHREIVFVCGISNQCVALKKQR